MKYKVVRSQKLDELIDMVQSNISAGFIPIGGVSYAEITNFYGGNGIYMQAMTYMETDD